jgi:hypothetical protein
MGGKAYFLSALAVAALSGGGYYTYHHGRLPDWYWEAKIPENIEVLDVTDTAKLKHVLFSGEPWLLQCYSGLPYEGQWLPRPFRVHRVFQESLGSLAGLVKAGILDCEKRLPSNKSLVEKFGFVRRSQPLLVLAAGGVKPRQLPANSVSSAYGVTAFVKPKAESKVHKVGTQKTLEAVCGGRRPCLLTRMKPDSVVLEQLARTFRTVEVVTLGENLAKVKLSWGRGEEVGETLEEEEAQHFGQRVSFLKYDSEAARGRKGSPPPRLLRGFGGDEDLPSLSRFVTASLAATEGFMTTEFPKIAAPVKPKKAATPNDNAEVQARRAKARAASRAKEESEREAKQAAWEAQQAAKKLSKEEIEELRRQREAQRREAMQAEAEAANDIVESVEEGEEEDDDFEAVEEEDYSDDTLDLDA